MKGDVVHCAQGLDKGLGAQTIGSENKEEPNEGS